MNAKLLIFGSACWARTSDPLINSLTCCLAEPRIFPSLKPSQKVARSYVFGSFLPMFSGRCATYPAVGIARHAKTNRHFFVTIFLMAALAGCGEYEPKDTRKSVGGGTVLVEITTKSGRPCVAMIGDWKGGLSCDWNYKPTPKEP